MENKKPSIKTLIGAITFMIIFILGFIITQEYTLQTGQEVFLNTMPVDPRDPLRGDYVILRYEIEQDEKVTDYITQKNLQEGDVIYITLNINDDSLASVSSVNIDNLNSGLFIKGKIEKGSGVDLGIGKYFVPEGTGKEIEKVRSEMQVLVAIDTYGTAKIKNLHYQGTEINPDTFIAK